MSMRASKLRKVIIWRKPSSSSSSVKRPAQGPTASPSRLSTRIIEKARSRIDSGSTSISGRGTEPALGILTLEKSGLPPGRTAGSGTCKLRGAWSFIRLGLPFGFPARDNLATRNPTPKPYAREISLVRMRASRSARHGLARQAKHARQQFEMSPDEDRHARIPKDQGPRRRDRRARQAELMDHDHADDRVHDRADDEEHGGAALMPGHVHHMQLRAEARGEHLPDEQDAQRRDAGLVARTEPREERVGKDGENERDRGRAAQGPQGRCGDEHLEHRLVLAREQMRDGRCEEGVDRGARQGREKG